MRLERIWKLFMLVGLLSTASLTTPHLAMAAQQQSYATVEQLAAEILSRLQRDPRVIEVVANPDDPAQIYLSRANQAGGRVRVDVTNLLGRLRGLTPAETAESIRQFVETVAAGPQAGPLDPAQIYANVRPMGYLRQDGKNLSDTLVFEELAGDLIILYQVDGPQALRALNWSEVGGRSLGELAQISRQNLDTQIKGLIEQRIGEDVSVFVIEDNPFLSPALLLSDQFHGYVAERFPDGYMLGVPQRDFVIAFNKKDPEALRSAREVIDRFTEDDRDMTSPLIFERRDGRLAVVDEYVSK
jgi:hypothetical protein